MNNSGDFLTSILPAVISTLLAILTAIITARLTSRGYLHQAKADLEKEYLSRFNSKKWEVYTQFIKLAPRIIGNGLGNIDPPADNTGLDWLASEIVLAASDKVVTAFRIWREASAVYGQGDAITKDKLFNLIAEMRKDLGNKHTRLGIDDLLGALRTTG